MAHVFDTMPVTFDAAENDPIFSDRSAYVDQLGFEPGQVDVPVGVLGNGDDIGDRFAPRQFVGVMLERPDEDDRALAARDVLRQVEPVVEVGGEPQVHDPDQLVDRAGGTGSAEDDAGLVVAADRVADDLAGVLAQPRGLQAGAGRLGVGVGVAGEDLVADEVLDEAQRPTRRRVVGVGDPVRAVRAVHHLIVADDRFADPAEQRCLSRIEHVINLSPRSCASLRRRGSRRADGGGMSQQFGASCHPPGFALVCLTHGPGGNAGDRCRWRAAPPGRPCVLPAAIRSRTLAGGGRLVRVGGRERSGGGRARIG